MATRDVRIDVRTPEALRTAAAAAAKAKGHASLSAYVVQQLEHLIAGLDLDSALAEVKAATSGQLVTWAEGPASDRPDYATRDGYRMGAATAVEVLEQLLAKARTDEDVKGP